MRECASFRAGCPPKVLGSTALSRIGCMVNGPSWNRPVCSPLRNWRVASVTTLAVKWSIILHNRSLELALVSGNLRTVFSFWACEMSLCRLIVDEEEHLLVDEERTSRLIRR